MSSYKGPNERKALDGFEVVELCLPALPRVPCQSSLVSQPSRRGTRRMPRFLHIRFRVQRPYVATSRVRKNGLRSAARSTSIEHLHPVRSTSSRALNTPALLHA